MARPWQFDEEHVVDAAMHAFWMTDYQATTTDDRCQVTGLSRSSIYNAFPCTGELLGVPLSTVRRPSAGNRPRHWAERNSFGTRSGRFLTR